MSAPNQLYFPAGDASSGTYPYFTNDAMGASLVKSLPGGTLNFNFIVGTSSVSQLVPSALAQEWQQCGINAHLTPESSTAQTQGWRVAGTMQIWYSLNGGTANPYAAASLYTLSSAGTYNQTGVFGYDSPTIANLTNATGATVSTQARTQIWGRIYSALNKSASIIPVWASAQYFFTTKNLHNLEVLQGNPIFNHAWLSS